MALPRRLALSRHCRSRSLGQRIKLTKAFAVHNKAESRGFRAADALIRAEGLLGQGYGVEHLDAELKVAPLTPTQRNILALKLEQKYVEPGFFTNGGMQGVEPDRTQTHQILQAGKAAVSAYRTRSQQRVERLEQGYIARLDTRFVANREKFLATLKNPATPPEKLYSKALELIQAIGEQVRGSDIADRKTGEVHGASSFEGTSYNMFGGANGHISGGGSMSGESRTLVLGAVNYPIKLKTARSSAAEAVGRDGTEGQLNSAETRMLLEKAVQVADIVAVLKVRAPAQAAVLSTWLQGSKIAIDQPVMQPGFGRPDTAKRGSYGGNSISINLSHIHADLAALKLKGKSFVSDKFADTMAKEVDDRRNQLADKTPFVDD